MSSHNGNFMAHDLGLATHAEAQSAVDKLNTDSVVGNEWRLPSLDDLRAPRSVRATEPPIEHCIEFSLGGCITIDEFQIDEEGGPESYRAFYAVRSGVPMVLRIERDINAPRRTAVWVVDRISIADTERLEKLITKALRIAEDDAWCAAQDAEDGA